MKAKRVAAAAPAMKAMKAKRVAAAAPAMKAMKAKRVAAAAPAMKAMKAKRVAAVVPAMKAMKSEKGSRTSDDDFLQQPKDVGYAEAPGADTEKTNQELATIAMPRVPWDELQKDPSSSAACDEVAREPATAGSTCAIAVKQETNSNDADEFVPPQLYIHVPKANSVTPHQLIGTGTYRLEPERANGHPLWRHSRGDRWLYHGCDNYWHVGDDHEHALDFDCDLGYIRHADFSATLPQDLNGEWEMGPDWCRDKNIAMVLIPDEAAAQVAEADASIDPPIRASPGTQFLVRHLFQKAGTRAAAFHSLLQRRVREGRVCNGMSFTLDEVDEAARIHEASLAVPGQAEPHKGEEQPAHQLEDGKSRAPLRMTRSMARRCRKS